jgi:hypothetical protein
MLRGEEDESAIGSHHNDSTKPWGKKVGQRERGWNIIEG